jgi:shikimate kinase
MNIILIGYRGCGKTSTGWELAKLLDRPFFDTDRMVFAKTGRTVREIVEAGGWQSFREAEKAVIAELSGLDGAILSLGGGSVLDPDNVSALKGKGRFVWLHADARVLASRMNRDPGGEGQRPSLTGGGTLAEIEQVLAERSPVYRSIADVVVDAEEDDPAGIAAEIARRLGGGKKRKKGLSHVR